RAQGGRRGDRRPAAGRGGRAGPGPHGGAEGIPRRRAFVRRGRRAAQEEARPGQEAGGPQEGRGQEVARCAFAAPTAPVLASAASGRVEAGSTSTATATASTRRRCSGGSASS